eukprot:GEMP01035890.1.p1 GENE.GEMP01035890.1~~GEMP01035890.1.p1  ORF type:complete len:433 (+),score=81.87 GEMP01035890.1:79-1299(+)
MIHSVVLFTLTTAVVLRTDFPQSVTVDVDKDIDNGSNPSVHDQEPNHKTVLAVGSSGDISLMATGSSAPESSRDQELPAATTIKDPIGTAGDGINGGVETKPVSSGSACTAEGVWGDTVMNVQIHDPDRCLKRTCLTLGWEEARESSACKEKKLQEGNAPGEINGALPGQPGYVDPNKAKTLVPIGQEVKDASGKVIGISDGKGGLLVDAVKAPALRYVPQGQEGAIATAAQVHNVQSGECEFIFTDSCGPGSSTIAETKSVVTHKCSEILSLKPGTFGLCRCYGDVVVKICEPDKQFQCHNECKFCPAEHAAYDATKPYTKVVTPKDCTSRQCQGDGNWEDEACYCSPCSVKSATNNVSVGKKLLALWIVLGVLGLAAIAGLIVFFVRRQRTPSASTPTEAEVPP